MGFANNMALGVSEGIFRAEHESKTFLHVRFWEKAVENPNNSIFLHFCKIVELNIDVLEPLLLSEIDKWAQSHVKFSRKSGWNY